MPREVSNVTPQELAEVCSICREGECDTKLSDCGHLFHWHPCLLELMDSGSNKCPNCRTHITSWFNRENGRWMDYG